MKVGDKVRAQFMTVPEEFPGKARGKKLYPPGGGAGMNAFPERLKRLRERKRIKQYVLSELCGLHRDAVRRYEAGEATPTTDALESIADKFGVSVDYLLGRTDNPMTVDDYLKKF